MQPQVARVGDIAHCPSDSHGCLACAHSVSGPATTGSANVKVNGLQCVRVTDAGIHSTCCGPNTWEAKGGSAAVFVNGLAVHRVGDVTKHCGGIGKMTEGSENVFAGG